MKKAISILLALLILTSNFNLTLAMHYCGGELADYAVQVGEVNEFGLGCGMEKRKSCTSDFTEMLSKTNDCCDDSSFCVEIDDDFALSAAEFNFISIDSQPQNNFLVAFRATFVAPYFTVFSLDANPKHSYKYYLPPSLKQDKNVLLQTFLI